MIHGLDDVRQGFEVSADVVVVGSGAAGAVASVNFARAGLKTVVLEAGPRVRPEDMTRDAPLFLARYFWEGGLRLIGGRAQIPSMQGRCLGGSTVMNSAIMLPLPKWVREEWARDEGLDFMLDRALDTSFERAFERTGTRPTPMAVMGRRNLVIRDALEHAGVGGAPLPRAVIDCEGCADCLTGCVNGRKQSMDRTYLPDAVEAGATVYTCSSVERLLVDGQRAVGVTGQVVVPQGRHRLAPFTVRAPLVVLCAGVLATPVILQRSGVHAGGRVGGSLYVHIGGGIVGVMDEPVDPWVGATQGWGAMSEDVRGLKFESLWAPPSVLAVKWGGIGRHFLERLGDIRHATVGVALYRGRVDGSVKAKRNGLPRLRLRIPQSEVRVVCRGLKQLADAILAVGARYVFAGMPGCKEEMRTPLDTEALLSPALDARHLSMTANHVFGSCRMSADSRRGAVDPTGKVHGVDGVYILDTSIFPSGTAVNPQATAMALADWLSRPLCELGRA